MTIADLGNDFYLARFSYKDDHDTTMFGGLWLIANHYLSVQ